MYMVVPPKTEKHILFLSPVVTTRELPLILQTLCNFGVTVIDIQRINFDRLQYEGDQMSQHFNRNFGLFRIRGSTYQIPTGFVLKIAREGLTQKYKSRIIPKVAEFLGHLDQQYGSLLYLTSSDKEYKTVK